MLIQASAKQLNLIFETDFQIANDNPKSSASQTIAQSMYKQCLKTASKNQTIPLLIVFAFLGDSNLLDFQPKNKKPRRIAGFLGLFCIKMRALRQLRRPDLNHKSLKTYIWVFKLFLSHCLQFQFFCGIISITSKSRCERVMTMERIFNITGSCNPQQHYMVNLDSRLAEIKKMIDRGDYFTINRGR